MLGQVKVILAMLAVFIAAFTLFWIFDQLQKLADSCRTNPRPICEQMNGLSLPIMIILLIIGGFSLVICVIVYILLSFR